MSISSASEPLNHHLWVLPHQTPLQLDKEGIKESHCEKGGGGGDYSREAINRGARLFAEIR